MAAVDSKYADAIEKCFIKRLDAYTTRIANEMKNNINAYNAPNRHMQKFKGEVHAALQNKVKYERGLYSATIGIIDQPMHIYYKAFIMAYGSGVHINSSKNKWFSQYKSDEYGGSKLWNPLRPTNKIEYRASDDLYFDFFKNTFKYGALDKSAGYKTGSKRLDNLNSYEGNLWFNNALERLGADKPEKVKSDLAEMFMDCVKDVPIELMLKGDAKQWVKIKF